MPLIDTQCRTHKHSTRTSNRLFDGGGLFLEARESGSRLWRLKFRLHGKERILALGKYPEVPLSEARKARDKAKRLISQGIDPVAQQRAAKDARTVAAQNTFELTSQRWMTKKAPSWTEKHADKVRIRLRKHVYPYVGHRPIEDITTPELLSVLTRMEDRGIIDTAHRVRSYCEQIYAYAISTGIASRNVASDLRGALPERTTSNYATLKDPADLRRLLKACDTDTGELRTIIALRLSIMLFQRPGEIRAMEWEEVDLDKALWTIPPAHMKLRKKQKESNKTEPHTVPLPRQAVELLMELVPHTHGGRYVFGGTRKSKAPLSDGTINKAMRRMGFGRDMITAHGFRHLASTELNETLQWHGDVIESQLSHQGTDKIRGIYNKAKYLKQRVKMMQVWADYLDDLKASTGEAKPISAQF
ncbi:tyrosine-type recombinase/integrase [Lysobacter spongiae]|uniref:Tyrosine-type recombinase/integrase n=1 Tax=Marilutibacter spongiae TaxID=2025720 RepID=A0A7W3Y7P0_9GAMM|nr:tyrosine-type recombinase/integrase [Lysobacter spongiae]